MEVDKATVLRLGRALERAHRRHPSWTLDVDWGTMVAVIAHLKLALRHPGARNESSGCVRRLLNEILSRITAIDAECGDLLRLGDDPGMDVERE